MNVLRVLFLACVLLFSQTNVSYASEMPVSTGLSSDSSNEHLLQLLVESAQAAKVTTSAGIAASIELVSDSWVRVFCGLRNSILAL